MRELTKIELIEYRNDLFTLLYGNNISISEERNLLIAIKDADNQLKNYNYEKQ